MRGQEDGVVGVVAAIVGGVVGLLVVTGVVLYAQDYRVDATVKDTRCERGEVKVETKLFGIDHTVKGVPLETCNSVEAGNFVQYRVRTQRTTLYDVEGGRCIYDSKTGINCGSGAFPLLP